MRNITQEEVEQKLENLINTENVKLYDEEKGHRLYKLVQRQATI